MLGRLVEEIWQLFEVGMVRKEYHGRAVHPARVSAVGIV